MISKKLENIQSQVTEVRTKLMQTLDALLPNSKLTFTKETAPYVTDEEECVRLKAKSVSKEQITLEDDTTFDISDIGTDDLLALVESVYHELENKK